MGLHFLMFCKTTLGVSLNDSINMISLDEIAFHLLADASLIAKQSADISHFASLHIGLPKRLLPRSLHYSSAILMSADDWCMHSNHITSEDLPGRKPGHAPPEALHQGQLWHLAGAASDRTQSHLQPLKLMSSILQAICSPKSRGNDCLCLLDTQIRFLRQIFKPCSLITSIVSKLCDVFYWKPVHERDVQDKLNKLPIM